MCRNSRCLRGDCCRTGLPVSRLSCARIAVTCSALQPQLSGPSGVILSLRGNRRAVVTYRNLLPPPPPSSHTALGAVEELLPVTARTATRNAPPVEIIAILMVTNGELDRKSTRLNSSHLGI